MPRRAIRGHGVLGSLSAKCRQPRPGNNWYSNGGKHISHGTGTMAEPVSGGQVTATISIQACFPAMQQLPVLFNASGPVQRDSQPPPGNDWTSGATCCLTFRIPSPTPSFGPPTLGPAGVSLEASIPGIRCPFIGVATRYRRTVASSRCGVASAAGFSVPSRSRREYPPDR